VADLSAELVSFCRELIRTPSVNGENGERAVAELVASFAAAHGLRAELVGDDRDRPNVRVWSGDTAPKPALLLVAHLDTVPVGTEANWTHPPLAAELVDGRIYGRGAVDNKGGTAAALGALLLLREVGAPDAAAMFVGVPDEESGALGTLGVKYLERHGKVAGRGAIYTYPGTDKLVIGHRGLLRLELRAEGRALHTGSREWQDGDGCNALTGLAEVVLGAERLELPRGGNGFFGDWRTVVTPTIFHAGSGPSIGPDVAEGLLDIRLTPDHPADVVEQQVRALAATVSARRRGLTVRVERVVELPPTEIAPNERIVTAIRQATRETLGHDPQLVVAGPANESYLFNQLGIATCAFGPDGSEGHCVDEYVIAESLAVVAQIYARTAALLIGS
jgi:acetylornithine deacetylase/succinyl-diaminopimelate desuccinylase-like protein